MKYYWPLLTLLLLALGCKETPLSPSGFEDLNAIGNRWVYHRYVDVASVPELMTVEITGDTLMSNGSSARVWQFALPADTFYRMVRIEQDTFKMFLDVLDAQARHKILMKGLTVGQSWEGAFCKDTSIVVAQGETEVEGETYQDAWHIERTAGYCVNWSLEEDIWWRNDLGFIRLAMTEQDFGSVDLELWLLVDIQ